MGRGGGKERKPADRATGVRIGERVYTASGLVVWTVAKVKPMDGDEWYFLQTVDTRGQHLERWAKSVWRA